MGRLPLGSALDHLKLPICEQGDLASLNPDHDALAGGSMY